MPNSIKLLTDLCSASTNDLPYMQISNQIHKHTFTCYKRGEENCRFNIPHWPSDQTLILFPFSAADNIKRHLRLKAVSLKKTLEDRNFTSMEEFLLESNLTYDAYLNVIRASLKRPTVIFKRSMTEIYTNTFNPWIATVLNSNMDLQFVLEEYSCAQYVVEYVNKSNRGISQLHRELIKLFNENPESEYKELMKKISLRLLNNVEMSAQEAAWYLLRQPMSKCSRQVVYVPTVHPEQRYKSKKRRIVMEREGLDENSTDVWTKSFIQKYEERPLNLQTICLADFVAWYTPVLGRRRNIVNEEDIDDMDSEDEHDQDYSKVREYRRRNISRIIRYRNYDIADINNYKREMVLLFHPFKNEHVEILDRNKYLQLYDDNKNAIMEKRKEYQANINIEELMNELRLLCETNEDILNNLQREENERQNFVRDIVRDNNENNDDMFHITDGISVVKKRTNVLSKQQYCNLMQKTNSEQRELILEFIHRLSLQGSDPIQVYLAGPTGSGKTFTIKLIMETLNRFGQQQNELRNSYIACASTGKAAINLNGTTVHSAFRISPLCRNVGQLPENILHQYHRQFVGVKCVIIDEISMLGSDLFHKVNKRIQDISANYDAPFGGINMLLAGDFRQLPPVNARPIYKGSTNTLAGNVLWQTLHYFKLTRVMRQSNLIFSNILTQIGNGECLDSSGKALIESRFRTKEWCAENLKGVIRLFHRNNSVDDFNKHAVVSSTNFIAKDHIIGYNNVRDLTNARNKLHKMSTAELGGLPYLIPLAIDSTYMVTVNIDVEDALVNGIIGILKYIEYKRTSDAVININMDHSYSQPPPNCELQEEDSISRLWFKFPNKDIGKMARIKVKPYVLSVFQENLNDALQWTPLEKSKVNITLSKEIKCKRIQFQIVPAAAITVHKAQGATFDQIVYDYDRAQQNQLVYVGLSRVTSLDGLYLTNSRDDFIFYHANGNQAPSVKEIRDEYLRLDQYKLPTITSDLKNFLTGNDIGQGHLNLRICLINAQNLVAHSNDILTDQILMNNNFLTFTETWMNSSQPVVLNGYRLITARNTSDIADGPSTSRAAAEQSRRAGGVAIYENVLSSGQAIEITCEPDFNVTKRGVGDICLAALKNNTKTECIIGCAYFHPKATTKDRQQTIMGALMQYSTLAEVIFGEERDTSTPIILLGDFNLDADKSPQFFTFKLDYVPNSSPTTLGGTNIDMVFQRNMTAQLKSYVAYFSYHRPILTKIQLTQ